MSEFMRKNEVLNKKNIYDQILTFIVLLLPIINQYYISKLTFLDLFSSFLCFYYICVNQKLVINKYSKLLYFYLFYIVVFGLVALFRFQDADILNTILRYLKILIIYTCFISILPKMINKEYFFESYKKIAIFLSVIIIGQAIIFYIFNKPVYLLLNNCLLNYNGITNSSRIIGINAQIAAYAHVYRPSAFFIEPAHYAAYILPGLVISLFCLKDDRGRVKTSLLLTLGAIITTSMLAIVGVVLIWIYYLKKYLNIVQISIKKIRMQIFFISIISLVVLISININDTILMNFGKKIKNIKEIITLGEFVSNSTTLRLFRGIAFYLDVDSLSKLIGVGFGNISNYYYEFNIRTFFDPVNKVFEVAYMNGFSTILVSSGIFGLFLYIWTLFKLYLINLKSLRAMLLCFCFSLSVSSFIGQPIYYIMLLMIFLLVSKGE